VCLGLGVGVGVSHRCRVFSDHIISQMFRRNISLDEVKIILDNGEVIKEYQEDEPYPSFLLFGIIDLRPLHLLVAKDLKTGNCIMVTVYEPDKNVWSSDFKTKLR
jgi:hypothetical protein